MIFLYASCNIHNYTGFVIAFVARESYEAEIWIWLIRNRFQFLTRKILLRKREISIVLRSETNKKEAFVWSLSYSFIIYSCIVSVEIFNIKKLFADRLIDSFVDISWKISKRCHLLKYKSQAQGCERSMATMKKLEASGLTDARKNAETFEKDHVRALQDGNIPLRDLPWNSRTFRLLSTLPMWTWCSTL